MSDSLQRRERLENDMRVSMGALFAEMDRLRAEVKRLTAASLDTVANRVSEALPGFYEVNICIEPGAAWVTLTSDGCDVPLPDSVDRTLVEQVDAALAAALAAEKEGT